VKGEIKFSLITKVGTLNIQFNKFREVEMTRKILFLSLILLVIYSVSFAAITGKIAGVIRDAESGDPLPGVNVLLDGTQLGAATNLNGEYFILNVSPKVYNLKASFIGYSVKVATQVRVNIDRTTTVDFEMEMQVIEGQEIVVTAKADEIRRDVSYSQQALSAEDIMSIPALTNDVRDAIALGVGIDRDLAGHLLIRGGDRDGVGYFVDDFSKNDKRLGTPVIKVPKASIEAVQILTGGFNAEYGQARSGMINIVTKDASKAKYHMSLDYRASPAALRHHGPNVHSPDNWWKVGKFLTMEPSADRNGDGDPDFMGWNAFFEKNWNEDRTVNSSMGRSAEECYEIWQWRHRAIPYSHKADNYAEGTFSGPVPFTGGKLTFYVDSYYDQMMLPFPYAVREDYRDSRQSLKLKYDMTNNITLRYTGTYNQEFSVTNTADPAQIINPHYYTSFADGWRNLQDIYYYGGASRIYDTGVWRSDHGLEMTHTLSPSSFYTVRGEYNRTHYRIHHNSDMRDENTVAFTTSLGMEFNEEPAGFHPDKYKDQLTFSTLGVDNGARDYSSYDTYSIRADYTNQATTTHQLKAGVGGNLSKMNLVYGRDKIDRDQSRRFDRWTNRNIDYNEVYAYFQDKIEFEGMILNAGLRTDYFGTNEGGFTDLYSDYFAEDGGAENSINFDSLYFAPRGDVDPMIKLSPRVGISHPISDNSKLFFNYGYFYQRGSVEQLFTDVRQRTSRLRSMSNPELDFRKTISYELGVEQNLSDLLVYKLAGYYKDISGDISNVNYRGLNKDINYNRAENSAYADVRGFELELKSRPIYNFTGWLNYNYMLRSTGNYGWSTVYEDPLEYNQLKSANRSKPKPTPFLRANLQYYLPENKGTSVKDLFLSDILLSTNVRWESGAWLTYHHEVYYPGDEENNIHWTPEYYFDMLLEKGFSILGQRVSAYMQVQNLFNSRFLTTYDRFWSSKISVHMDSYLDYIAENGHEIGDWEQDDIQEMLGQTDYQLLYGPARDIWFGLRFEF
jgi:outer membrane receptor protein involved in Fe transport